MATFISQNIMKKPFGIDLGTTYSTVAINNARGGPQIVKDSASRSAIPSMVSFLEDNEVFQGSAAEARIRENSSSTIFDTKRMFGQRYSSPRIGMMQKDWPFKVEKADKDEGILIDIPTQHRKLRPYEVTAELLKHLIDVGNTRLPRNLKNRNAVITVPANFSEVQREETRKAAKLAGITVLRLLNEPTAAGIACAYVYDFFFESNSSTALIYDFGGGTLDVSLLKVEQTRRKNKLIFTVKAIEGDNHLGGRDFDEVLLNYASEKLQLDKKNQRLMATARDSIINAKIILSTKEEADIIIDFGEKQYKMKITRREFEHISQHLIQRCLLPVQRLLENNGIDKSLIDQIILTGGSSHMPFVKNVLTEYFDKEPFTGIDPQEAVAQGASIIAYKMMNDEDSVDEDRRDELIEVASRSIGIAYHGGEMSFHIKKNQKLPARETVTYSNWAYNEGLLISIFEGENVKIEDNDYLGKFEIHGIPKCPQGEAPVEVTFEMDDDGILHVQADLVNGGKANEITVARFIGEYTDEQAKEKELIVNTEKIHRQANASALREFYQEVKMFFKNPDNKMNIFVDKATFDNIISDCEKGIKDPLFSMPSVRTAKKRFIEMLDTYIKLHKEIPSVLE